MAIAVVLRQLSGSIDSLPITLSQTVSPGLVVHQSVSGSNIFDQIFIFASHTSTLSITVQLEWGPTSNTLIEEIPAKSVMYPIINGNLLQGHTAATATIIKMFTSSTGVHIYGHVNRTTES